MLIASPWSSPMWGLSGLFLIQMSVVASKYIHILATPQHLSQKWGLLHSVNRGTGLRWGLRPKCLGKNTNSFPFGHLWLLLASWSHLPTQSSRNPIFSLSWKHRSQSYWLFTLPPRAQFQVLFGVMKTEMLQMGFIFEEHGEDRKPDSSSWSRLAPAYIHALALALPCLRALGYLASPPFPMTVHASGIICTLDTHLFQSFTKYRVIWYLAYHFFQVNSSSWELFLACSRHTVITGGLIQEKSIASYSLAASV